MERDPLTATGTSGYAAFPEKTGSVRYGGYL